MKIVKMHKGSREAFDDFLAQRLNEVEVDNDMADKYFAEMNLPVPVIPATKLSFLSKNKTTLWLVFLLFITSFSAYVLVKNNTIKTQNDEIVKGRYLLENETKNNNVNLINSENNIPEKEFVIKKAGDEKNTRSVEKANKTDEKVTTKKIKILKCNSFSKTNNILFKEAISKSVKNTKAINSTTKSTQILIDKKIVVIERTTNMLKTMQESKKKANADSLYIIW